MIPPDGAHSDDLSFISNEDGAAQDDEHRSKRARQGTGEDPLPKARYETCRTCLANFDITKNTEEAGLCGIHEGEIEFIDTGDVNDYPWDVNEEGIPEPVKSIEENETGLFAEHPYGFIWNCCEGEVYSVGCIPKQHEAR